MSLQMVDAANPASRKELRERIGQLNVAREACWHDRNDTEEVQAQSRAAYFGAVKELYFALTGSMPSEAEMQELAAS